MSVSLFMGEPMTKREVLIARKAFAAGSEWRDADSGHRETDYLSVTPRERAEAERLYPLPKVTRPRVRVDETGMGWKVEDGSFWYTLTLNPHHLEWTRDDPTEVTHELTATRAELWADLLVNPTEEVEA